MGRTQNRETDNKRKTELTKLRYRHVESLIALGIVAVIAIGGFVCMIRKVEGGQTIVVGVLGLITGWIGARKANHGERS